MSDLITLPRATVQQALEALDAWKDAAPSQWTTYDEKTITALKAALEQPEPPEQEPIPFSGADEKPPVFGRRWRIAKDGFGLQLDDDGPYVHIDDALSVLHAALEQPKQAEPDVEYYGLEPWEVPQHIPFATAIYPAHSPDKPFLALGDCAHLYRDAAKCVPLFTHPPRREWRGLTDEELRRLWRESSFRGNGGQIDWFTEGARVAEAALKERNA